MKTLSNPVRDVIYGVTDRSSDPFLVKLNDFLIDHSPVNSKEKAVLFDSLQLLVSSGVRFTRALTILADRARNLRLQRILRTIVYDMEQRGMGFSAAMAKYPKVFRESEVKMVYSGELAGQLEEVLESIANQIHKNLELEIRVRSALMYPATVLGAIILAGVVVMIFVVPKFKILFADFGGELPIATKILIGTSNLVLNYWWLLLTVLIGGWFLFQNWKNTDRGRRAWDGFLLRAPLIKTLINDLQTVRIASNFGTLMQSGIPVAKALRILGEIMPNAVVADAIFEVEKSIREGKQLHTEFRENPIFNPILGEVIEIGEKSGSIPKILGKTAKQYELEVDAQLKNLTTLLEPAIILLVGAAVVFMAMAIMTPIFKLQEMFAG